MPGFGTTDRTYDNAVSLIRCLEADFIEVDIKDAVNIHFRDIGQDPSMHDVTYENGQARERTQILMDIANKSGGMVIGTGDLSELALGWATYNGDHMSMYAVNASVPKTLVRHLVRYYADTCGDETLKQVLLDVLDTPVSPELLPPEDGKISQKTEDLVGPYELHDFYLYHMLRLSTHRQRFTVWQNRHLLELMTMQRFLSGWRHFTAVSLRSSLNVPACRTDQKSEVLRYLRVGICVCRPMRVPQYG